MAIVKMSEFNLYVMNDRLESVLKGLQRYKEVSFAKKPKKNSTGFRNIESTYDFDESLNKQQHIQEILKHLQVIERQNGQKNGGLIQSFNVRNMTYEALEQAVQQTDLDEILDKYSELFERKRKPVEGFECYIPWEEQGLSTETMLQFQNQKPLIGTVPLRNLQAYIRDLKTLDPIYFMHRIDDEKKHAICVLVVGVGEEEAAAIIGEKHEFEARSAVSLKIEDAVDKMMDVLHQNLDKRLNIATRIKKIGYFKEVLQMHYEYLSNEALREKTREQFIQSDYVTVIRGWVETEASESFEAVINEITEGNYDLDIDAAPLHSQEVPIKLNNNKFNRAFEPITNMYSQPRYDELDPTPIFAPFYAFFFGMMLADVGYGLTMAIVLGLALKFINFKTTTRSMILLLFYASVPTMLWGAVYGSFFGGLVPLPALLDINYNFTTVLVMALGFGLIHLFAGMAVKAYIYMRDYKVRYVLYDVVFWYITLISAIMLISGMFTDIFAPYATYAMIAMVVSMVGIVLTNGRSAKTLPGKLVAGLYSLYGITNYVGDIVSYSRLMALGLAGASIGMAFNTMVGMLQGFGIVGYIAGIALFMFGHTFNLLISGLSSYVHSARLTYVEFFGKFFVGGGIPFKSFRAQTKYINVE